MKRPRASASRVSIAPAWNPSYARRVKQYGCFFWLCLSQITLVKANQDINRIPPPPPPPPPGLPRPMKESYLEPMHASHSSLQSKEEFISAKQSRSENHVATADDDAAKGRKNSLIYNSDSTSPLSPRESTWTPASITPASTSTFPTITSNSNSVRNRRDTHMETNSRLDRLGSMPPPPPPPPSTLQPQLRGLVTPPPDHRRMIPESIRPMPPSSYNSPRGSVPVATPKPPAQSRRAPGPQPQRYPPRAPAWKRVWKHVERGLDSLADLEESVSSTTHNWVSKTKSVVWKEHDGELAPSSYPSTSVNRAFARQRETQQGAPSANTYELLMQRAARKAPSKQAIPAHGGATPSSPPPSVTKDAVQALRASMMAPVETTPPAVPTQRTYPDVSSTPPNIDLEEETQESIWARMRNSLPSMPSLRRNSFRDYSALDAWRDEDEKVSSMSQGGLFSFWKKRPSSETQKHGAGRHFHPTTPLPPPLASLSRRSTSKLAGNLLSSHDRKLLTDLGRNIALVDMFGMVMLLTGLRSLLFVNLSEVMNGWAPLALIASYLAYKTNRLTLKSRLTSMSTNVAGDVAEEVRYASLYLRLLTGKAVDPFLPERSAGAVSAQAKARTQISRTNHFVRFNIALIVIMTVSVLQPMLVALASSTREILTLSELRSWPIDLPTLQSRLMEVIYPLKSTLVTLASEQASAAVHHPVVVAFQATVACVLLVAALLPSVEMNKRLSQSSLDDFTDDYGSSRDLQTSVEDLGSSSAIRLPLLLSNGAVENQLERWRIADADIDPIQRSSMSSLGTKLHRLGQILLLASVFVVPLVIFNNAGIVLTGSPQNSNIIRWDSLFDVAVILLVSYRVISQAIGDAIESTSLRQDIIDFLSKLRHTLIWRKYFIQSKEVSLQVQASISNAAGLVVRDLWSAHTAKRAWAVRGANFYCKGGEILLVLADDGAGKTRLLTTLADTIIDPPKQSTTTTRVRGSVAVCGLETTKWDKDTLRRRLALILSDTRSSGVLAKWFSGLSLEEILEPSDGLKTDASQKLGREEKAAILLALKITGLHVSLFPKLPSKMSTVVTTMEADLKPSQLRARGYMLSPAEWSKLLLTKALAESIYMNDNTISSTDKIENSLVGSILLLDDALLHYSEGEETRLLEALRHTGAATLITSNRWTSGRLADRIIVLKDGSIVEMGTHDELMGRGPQQSLYAAKWQSMS